MRRRLLILRSSKHPKRHVKRNILSLGNGLCPLDSVASLKLNLVSVLAPVGSPSTLILLFRHEPATNVLAVLLSLPTGVNGDGFWELPRNTPPSGRSAFQCSVLDATQDKEVADPSPLSGKPVLLCLKHAGGGGKVSASVSAADFDLEKDRRGNPGSKANGLAEEVHEALPSRTRTIRLVGLPRVLALDVTGLGAEDLPVVVGSVLAVRTVRSGSARVVSLFRVELPRLGLDDVCFAGRIFDGQLLKIQYVVNVPACIQGRSKERYPPELAGTKRVEVVDKPFRRDGNRVTGPKRVLAGQDVAETLAARPNADAVEKILGGCNAPSVANVSTLDGKDLGVALLVIGQDFAAVTLLDFRSIGLLLKRGPRYTATNFAIFDVGLELIVNQLVPFAVPGIALRPDAGADNVGHQAFKQAREERGVVREVTRSIHQSDSDGWSNVAIRVLVLRRGRALWTTGECGIVASADGVPADLQAGRDSGWCKDAHPRTPEKSVATAEVESGISATAAATVASAM